jgi:hypothetical protein
VCGSLQPFRKVNELEQLSQLPVTSVQKTNGQEDLTARLQPSVAIKPALNGTVIQEQFSKEADSANKIAGEIRTPGLIRPLTPNPSSHSLISSRPDANGQMASTPQPIQPTQTPESQIPTPSTTSSYVNQQPSSSVLMEPRAENRDKQPIAQQITQSMQNYSQATIDPNRVQNRSQQQLVYNRATSNPLWQDSSNFASDELPTRITPVANGNLMNGTSDSPTNDLLNPASFMATSKAAEQWRKSWRNRQYAEAGPAESVSRGQASVPTPLTSMQQSFLRMRAIKKTNKQQGKRSVNFGTWLIILLMICVIIGLGTYIIFSYLPSSPFTTQTSTSSNNTAQPSLTLVGTATQTVTIGRSIQVHGVQFGDNQSIIFLRDTATPITDSSGKNISTRTDSQGTFIVAIPIDNSWTVGSHSIEALDQSSNQNAFLTLEVIPQGTATTSSADLSITMQGKSVSQLNFTSVLGQANPGPQQISITNTSGSPLQWTAIAATNNNLNWLQINDNNDNGQLAISQPHSMLISVNTTGLKTTDKNHPYRGQIIFTINNRELLTLPVQLQIVDATPEMVLSPNPIVAPIGQGNTCQVGVALTLINLGSASISWAVNPDKENIKFINNGQPLNSGTLLPAGSQLPSGQPGDTIVLTLQCSNVQVGQTYTVRVYANQMQWTESVIITNG